MKVPSLNGDGIEYTVCQIKLHTVTLHLQASEPVPGWEARPYGSAVNLVADLATVMNINKIADGHGYLTKSLYDGGSTYILAGVMASKYAWYFQILTYDMVEPYYAFSISRSDHEE